MQTDIRPTSHNGDFSMTYQFVASEAEALRLVNIAREQSKRAYHMQLRKGIFEVRIFGD